MITPTREVDLDAPQRLEVPMLDLPRQFAEVREEVVPALLEVAESARYALGPAVDRFEEAFARYAGAKHCVAVNSGTSALHLALLAAGVGPGDEVITTPLTFISTCWAISYVRARPVFVDADPVSYCLDPNQVEDRVTARTKAILPVHLYGQMAELLPLQAICGPRGIPLIEDAAQAHGAEHYGWKAGSVGLCGCFSFYPSKNLGACGEAGAVVTSDAAVAARLRALRDHGQRQRHHHEELGFNYRMDGFQGAVLDVKLHHLNRWNQARRSLAQRYTKRLARLPLQLPRVAPGNLPVWYLYVILHPERDRLARDLGRSGIATGLHFPIPVHLQAAYAHLGHRPGDFLVAERVARECLSLPLFPELTVEQQDRVIEALHDALD